MSNVLNYIFVINLDKHIDRYSHYQTSPPRKLTNLTKYIKFSAVDGTLLTKKECEKMISLPTISQINHGKKMGCFFCDVFFF